MSPFSPRPAATQYRAEPDRQPAVGAARGNARRVTLPPLARVWLVAGVFFLLFFAAAAPSPLYGVYQAQWRFSATTLTAVFAAYALLLLGRPRPGRTREIAPTLARPRRDEPRRMRKARASAGDLVDDRPVAVQREVVDNGEPASTAPGGAWIGPGVILA
jgi:hypothetical protein